MIFEVGQREILKFSLENIGQQVMREGKDVGVYVLSAKLRSVLAKFRIVHVFQSELSPRTARKLTSFGGNVGVAYKY